MPASRCQPCEDGTGCLVNFMDLPSDLNVPTDYGGVNTDFLGVFHGLVFSNFYGIWSSPNASSVISNVGRLTTDEPTPGVIYSSMAYSLVYFEAVDSLMQVSCCKDPIKEYTVSNNLVSIVRKSQHTGKKMYGEDVSFTKLVFDQHSSSLLSICPLVTMV